MSVASTIYDRHTMQIEYTPLFYLPAMKWGEEMNRWGHNWNSNNLRSKWIFLHFYYILKNAKKENDAVYTREISCYWAKMCFT